MSDAAGERFHGVPLKERLLSLDILRGLCVVGMMMVDWPGSWKTRLDLFNHARWTGVTPPDFIFPGFMFAMGVAIPFSFQRRKEAGVSPWKLYGGIARRAVLLFLLGYFLNLVWGVPATVFPVDWSTMRVVGVLQRFAVVYPIVALGYLHLPPRRLLYLGMAILLGYWALMALVPVPGFGAPVLSQYPQGEATPNLAAWLDKLVLQHRVYEYPFDPEGILSTIPAIATAILGVIAGVWLRRTDVAREERVNRLMAWGVVLVIVGYFWGFAFPLSKKLWSSSFVVFMGGWDLLFLGSLVWALDVKGKTSRLLAIPRWYGRNAIAGIVIFTCIDGVMSRIPVWRKADQTVGYLKEFLNDHLFRSWLPDNHASWVYSVAAILLLSLLFRWFEERNWLIRV